MKLAFHRHKCELHYVLAICVAYDDASAWRGERTRDAQSAPARAVTLALYSHFVIWRLKRLVSLYLVSMVNILKNEQRILRI